MSRGFRHMDRLAYSVNRMSPANGTGYFMLRGSAIVKQMRILIADDNARVRKVLRQVLEEHEGWTVCCEVEDGLDAIEHANQCKPDLVLLDLAMPYANGFVAAGKISRLLPGIPIVMLTLYDSPEVRDEAKNLGVLQVIPKTDGRSLIAAIEALVQTTRRPIPSSV